MSVVKRTACLRNISNSCILKQRIHASLKTLVSAGMDEVVIYAPDQNLTWNSVKIFIKASKKYLTLS